MSGLKKIHVDNFSLVLDVHMNYQIVQTKTYSAVCYIRKTGGYLTG